MKPRTLNAFGRVVAAMFVVLSTGVLLAGCGDADSGPVASRTTAVTGPDVTIDVKPVGRAEKFKKPDPTEVKRYTAVVAPPRSHRRRRSGKPAATVKPKAKPVNEPAPKKLLPPDEDYYPVPKATEDFDPGEYRVPDGE